MNILITGGAGFIGSHVTDACVAAGHSVRVLDDLSHGKRENVNPSAQLVRMDLCAPGLKDLFAEFHFDCVIHHAAQMDVRVSVADPVRDSQVNIGGTLNLLEAMRAHRVGYMLFASTGGAIYGNQHSFPADESHPTAPISPYGVAKLAVEHYLEYYRQVHGLCYTVLRYANVYGPRQDPKGEAGVVAIFGGRILKGEPLTIYGDGSQTRDYVYVGDVAQANLLALSFLEKSVASSPSIASKQNPPSIDSALDRSNGHIGLYRRNGLNNATDGSRPVFNIGTGIETSVNALAALMIQAAGSDVSIHNQPPRAGEQQRSVIDPRRAEQVLRWSPRVSLGEGLTRTLAWFRTHQQGAS